MVTEFWAAITYLGDFRLWLAALLLIAVWAQLGETRAERKSRRKLLYLIVLSLSLTAFATEGMKQAIHAPRICDPAANPYCPADSSGFPSGHSSIAWAAFTGIWFFNCKDRRRAAIFVLPVLVSLSRLALGVHLPQDVIAGAALGAGITTAVWYGLRKKGKF